MSGLRFLALASLVVVSGVVVSCSGYDGGIEPTNKLPAPHPADTGDAQVTDGTGDTDGAGETAVPSATLVFVRPSDGAAVDGDWVAVELGLDGATLGGDLAVELTVSAGADSQVLTLTSLSTVVEAPAGPGGDVSLRAELLSGGAPLSPPVTAEIAVRATRVTPGLAFVTPLAGSRVGLEAPIAYELALTDFTLLATGVAASGPRQGRVSLVLDDGEPVLVTTRSGSLPAAGVGAHTLTATLVDEQGAPWEPAVSASVAFEVDLPPAVSIVAPADGAIIEGARLTIVIAPERFSVDGGAASGHGTWRVRLDGAQVASGLTGTTAALSGLAEGPHSLEVELRTSDDQALAPAVMASADFETLLLPPTLDIVLPTSASVAEGSVRVAVLPHHFTFTSTIPGPLVPASGGWQLLVDDVVVQDRLTMPQTEVVLTPGARKLTARLIDNAGQALSPAAETSRTLDVVEVATSVSILSPNEGETVPKRFPVAVAFEDFKLTQTVLGPNDDPVPGQGHFHAFLRKEGTATFVYQGFFLAETFVLQADSPGTWEVLVALHYENHSPVQPPVEDVVRVVVDDRPTIHIQSPRDGATVGKDAFAVAVAIDNFELIPIGEVSNTRGHYHVFIDTVYQDFYLDPVAITTPADTKPSALTPGEHQLQVFLHRSNHTPVDGAVGHTIEFTYDATPRVRILSPGDGARVTGEPFTLTFELDNLQLVDKAGEPAVPGEGHVHVFVDDTYLGYETGSSFPVTIDQPGEHTVKLTLHNNDHSAIPGTAAAFIDVEVDVAPRVDIVAPEDMGFVYAGDVEVLLAPENLADGLVEVWLDRVLVYEGAPGAVALPRLAEGEHEVFTVPLAADGTPLASGAIVTHRFEAVGLAPPTVSFVQPVAFATMGAGAAVTIGTAGFSLDGGFGRAPAVPGDGLWTLSVGEVTWGPFATPTVTLPAVPNGTQRLRAELWHRDGSRVVPQAAAEVTVQVSAVPRMTLLEPRPEAMWYGEELHVRAALAEAEVSPEKGWLSVRVDGRQAALMGRAEGVIGPFASGLHVLEVELLQVDRTPYAPRVMVTSQFRVGGAALPAVTITSPLDGAALSGGSVDVAFAVQNLTLDPVGLRGRAQAERGAALVYVDGRVKAIATSSPAHLTGLSPGAHTIEVVLAGLDLVPLMPGARDAVTVR